MNVVKCSNSSEPHFFDGDKYEACPHCGAAPLGGGPSKSDNKHGVSIKPSKKKESSANMSHIPEHTVGSTFGIFKKAKREDTETPVVKPSECKMPTGFTNPEEHKSWVEPKNDNTNVVEVPQNVTVEPSIASKPNDVAERISQNFDSTSGKTQGFFSVNNPIQPVKMETNPQFIENTEPCAGWLVCIKGAHFGRNLPIYAGKNSIGREESNKICLRGDMSVSREKHAWIMYEPKKREFYVLPGEGSGLTYLNEEIVMSNMKLAQYDKLEIGGGMYMFIPLCCENFTWEDYMGGN